MTTFKARSTYMVWRTAMRRRIFEIWGLIEAWRQARQTAWQTFIKLLTTGVLVALIVGASIKLKLYGVFNDRDASGWDVGRCLPFGA